MIYRNVRRRIDYLLAPDSSRKKRELRMKIDLFRPGCKYWDEYEEEIAYMKARDSITMFPYAFRERYRELAIEVKWDEEKELFYVLHDGRRLYYPSDMSEDTVRNMYRAIRLEQDVESPHRYFSEGFEFENNGIFCDVGCAEANIALEVADRAKAVLLFEASKRWIPALEATFAPYGDKVHIINQYAGNEVNDEVTTIDHELKRRGLEGEVYIKIDAEGSEEEILDGAKDTLKERKVNGAVCTYHRQEDAQKFEKRFTDMGFQTEFSRGWCIYIQSKELEPPYFRKGLIRVSNF